MKQLARLQRLERNVTTTLEVDQERQSRDEESRARMESAWTTMSASMSEDHARLVIEAYSAGMQDVRHPEWDSPAGTLLGRCLRALHRNLDWPYTQIKPEVVVAMPPVVANVYLKHQDSVPLHDCEECGYKVPHKYFERCPLCGGRIGWNAYWHKHKDDPRAE